ncbi:MAG TPA: ABC transporter ATP-binding protein [Bryobacteraceae bacterium]|jgi:ABC-2 type transport system ATP-binding protein|nr:ABC transporter ATP-binding protein [Bryobacteraceae bacterium]
MDPIIETRALTRKFGSLTAVDHVDLSVSKGEIFGLVGPDGAGKTTTLRLLAGLMDPTFGEVRVAGHDVSRQPQLARSHIGYTTQRFGLYPDLSVAENMAFYAELFGVSASDRASLGERLLQTTRMAPFVGRQAGRLSGGMKQKLALMCTLLHRPEILLLDEPTNGVDPVSRRDFWSILYELVKTEDITVFVTTAYLDEAERCNRVGLMHRGKLISCDTPKALRERWAGGCYELRIDGPEQRRVAALLRSDQSFVAVEPAGATLHVFPADGAAAGTLERVLEKNGLETIPCRRIVPSLEDIFIIRVHEAEAG